jgi:hypothetical protein
VASCWNCDASFSQESSWRPTATPQGPFRAFAHQEEPERSTVKSHSAITHMSLGENSLARQFGSFFLLANVVFSLALLAHSVTATDLNFSEALISSCFLLAIAFDVRCFLRGETTWIQYRIKGSTLDDRTALRVFGLGIDLVVWSIGISYLKPW